VELNLAHLEGSCVAVPHEVPDKAPIVAHRFGALAIGNSGGLNDGVVITHVIDEAYKAVVQHRKSLTEDLFQFRYPDPVEAVFCISHLRPPEGFEDRKRILKEEKGEGKSKGRKNWKMGKEEREKRGN
jgi:hypothetical protein